MTKRQFMEELRSSLEGMVSQAVIQENMNYYEDYINEQTVSYTHLDVYKRQG